MYGKYDSISPVKPFKGALRKVSFVFFLKNTSEKYSSTDTDSNCVEKYFKYAFKLLIKKYLKKIVGTQKYLHKQTLKKSIYKYF